MIRIMALMMLTLGCEAQLSLGSNTAVSPRGRLVELAAGQLSLVGNQPVTIRIERAPKPWGLQLVGLIETRSGPIEVQEESLVQLGGQTWQVLSVRATLKESRLHDQRMVLRPVP